MVWHRHRPLARFCYRCDMTKQMRCWQCGGEMSVGAEMVGTTVHCPHCSGSVTVPGELFGAPMASAVTSCTHNTANKSPSGAAALNFLFWGAGYVYLGRSWGLWILIPFCLLGVAGCLVMMETGIPPQTLGETVLANLPGVGMAFHAYSMAKKDR